MKMTKAQARKRLKEANDKVSNCYLAGHISATDFVSIGKILAKCSKRLE